MDDPISILLSLNKISLLAFFITMIFVGYQIFLFKKETHKKNVTTIPDFKSNATAVRTDTATSHIVKNKNAIYHRSSFVPIIIGMILLLIFASIFLFGLIKSNYISNQRSSVITPTPIINLVASKGIKIYNQNWQTIDDNTLVQMKPGQTILVGIATINGVDIDSARIRINKETWDQKDITLSFNKSQGVFYREYAISTGSAFLKIEAELHSVSDGWLGN